ncbi:hypothetical protein CcrC1_gp165 [Caulobacter phage C1]|nr:hypothetical protein CcrC1_gp165 [Caulobacter phage C1]UTU08394.1 hypothetical protein CcrC2_gp166 [Caulobacter phage C2]UTU08911.1 hypothetical protein CcrJ4_gp160 [Caulobacter phage J4]UTU09467.1 hypothetical protein CcrBL47_gp181 [Caulobacter phage BL47]UTU10027.1 hypothetical protein CcrRB23_gp165 [Caulobacter phage RB23]WGN97062.1 hypothetical protein [Bertelyvirus sp.]
MPHHVFVGYDSREQAAYDVCVDSLVEHNKGDDNDIVVHKLEHRDLRRRGLFTRPWRIDETGQFWDERDGRPFSTEFSHSRFLVPTLASQMGIVSPVMFVDCDFLFVEPVQNLFHEVLATKPFEDGSNPLWVVKHEFSKAEEGVKMDGMVQQAYFRKLWSSLMIYDLRFPLRWFPTAGEANHHSGSHLHGFYIAPNLPMEDDVIGALDPAWNWIPGHSSDDIKPKAVHWSLGGPWMDGYEDTPYAVTWRQYRKATLLEQAGILKKTKAA